MRIRFWSLDTGAERTGFVAEGPPIPTTRVFSRDDARLAVIDEVTVRVYSITDRSLMRSIVVHPFDTVNAAAFTADGAGLIICHSHAMPWDIATGEKACHFRPTGRLSRNKRRVKGPWIVPAPSKLEDAGLSRRHIGLLESAIERTRRAQSWRTSLNPDW